ncbi:MAG TPA: alginate lyase family protein [Bacteroidota bacterium]
MKIPPLGQITTGIRYRILRPALWKRITLGRVTRQGDNAFLRSLGWRGSAQEFAQHQREQSRLRFFFHPRNRKDFFLNTLTTTQPYESILEEADLVLQNRFQTLGSPIVDLGDPLPWHRDFKSGKEWPILPSNKLDLLDLDNPSDVKVPWELSRFHQIWWLGKAHWLTGNRAYADKFVSLASDWIEKNPVGYGVNWSIAMEAAIRACNWIAGYYFFCESPSITPEFWVKYLRSLLTHGLFIESHIEYARVNGNHFLSNVTGLTFLGVFFRDLPCGRRWLKWAVQQLQAEMETQVYNDGVDHEKSTAYQRLVLELFYSAAILCRKNGIDLSEKFWKKLETMFEFVQSYTRPDGSIPLTGDADDGRLFRISMNQDINDHRHALSVGAILFRRADFKASAGRFDQETLWYFGGEGFEIHQILGQTTSPRSSRAFTQGGFFVMQNERAQLFVDAGELGLRGRGGHGHNDTLSFELWAQGMPFIVDSGTYAYTGDTKTRKLLQGTAAHNSVMVDESEIADWTGLWNIREDLTNPRLLIWESDGHRDILEAEHHGYSRLASPVVHRRTFVFDKINHEVVITDVLTGTGSHTLQLRLHFHPQVSLEKQEKNRYLASCDAGSLLVACSEPAEVVETLYSPSYGILLQSKGLQIRLHAALPHTITTRITLT